LIQSEAHQPDFGMPTILRMGPYRFFFWSRDCVEREHVHVQRNQRIAKFWLLPVRLADEGGFAMRELRMIERLVLENQRIISQGWDEYCRGH
jgi:hypothetical protein